MKKRVLVALMTLCLLFSVFACVALAAPNISVGDLPAFQKVCPGTALNLEAPEVLGETYAEGWEIQTVDGVWIPYDGQPFTEDDNGKLVRYFAANEIGEYVYSGNVCTLVVKHNPQGAYEYDGMYHWRDCADCGGQAEKGGHTTLKGDATSANKVCQVCGQVRTSQYTGLVAFWEWLLNLIMSFIG